MKKVLISICAVIALVFVGGWIYLSHVNNFKEDGSFEVSINDKPIEIHRDNNGVPYVIAQSKADAICGQGFVAAQDRLFQIEFYRLFIKGEAAAYLGKAMVPSDIKMRVLDVIGNAKRNYTYLNNEAKQFLAWYAEGYNEYLKVAQDEFPVELKLLGMEPQPLTPEEMVAVVHYIGFTHGQNMEDEILSLNLAARTKIAPELYPLNINPDRTKQPVTEADSLLAICTKALNKDLPLDVYSYLTIPKFGSNNWAVAGSKTESGQAIVCNDPHLDARLLPGIFYPVGLFCPEFKSVGLALPGVPGLVIGRNENVAFGVTNGYGDSQDLFIEDIDADFYCQNGEKFPIKTRKVSIAVKDTTPVEITIRSTERGPIISDFDVFDIKTKDVVTLRWSLAESKSESLGIEKFLDAKDAFEFRENLTKIDNIFFNYVVGDTKGNIIHQATGLIPKRIGHRGQVPQKVADLANSWDSFIPKHEMPHMINPERGWVGTANNDTRPDGYPYYYSSHFSPEYRYVRIKQAFAEDKKWNDDDCWNLILDCKNTQAEKLCPIFIKALEQDENTKDLAEILSSWEYIDDVDQVGATVYNVIYDKLVNLVLDDELPDDIEEQYWKSGYFWIQRIDEMILTNSKFIDNANTDKVETLDELIIEAGVEAKDYLTERLGANTNDWEWGKIHTVTFTSMIKRSGFGTKLLGAETYEKAGSNSTINRGGYNKYPETTFEAEWFSTFRMVADMTDREKMRGVMSGGNAARIFHSNLKSQLDNWSTNKWIPYWISEEKVIENTEHTLVLK